MVKDNLVGKRVGIGVFGFPMPDLSDVVTASVDNVNASGDDYANMVVTLVYRRRALNDEEEITDSKQLYFLSNRGDSKWTHMMRQKVWAGRYPDTVAIDINTHDVYFVYLEEWGVALELFGELTELDFSTIRSELVAAEPYEIGIDPDAMFLVIDGAEGYNYLRDHLFVRFKCCLSPIDVHKMED